MSRIPIVPAAAIAAMLACGQAPASWDAGPTNAVLDGIGYRSNLIDPRNPYASSERRNFGVLLARLGMIEDWTDVGGAATAPARAAPGDSYEDEVAILEDDAYASYLHDVLAPRRLDDLLPFTPRYARCLWTSFETTQRYIRALTSVHAPHEMRARLVAARHRLAPAPGECVAPDSLDGYLEALRGIDGPQWRPWRDYLEGAARFHAEDYGNAARVFARIPRTDTWLGATAAYMQVRTAFRQLRDHEANRYWSKREDKDHEAWDGHWRQLAGAIENFERGRLDWGLPARRAAPADVRGPHEPVPGPGRGAVRRGARASLRPRSRGGDGCVALPSVRQPRAMDRHGRRGLEQPAVAGQTGCSPRWCRPTTTARRRPGAASARFRDSLIDETAAALATSLDSGGRDIRRLPGTRRLRTGTGRVRRRGLRSGRLVGAGRSRRRRELSCPICCC